MSILESLITNRTAADVARWRALRDKGFDAMSADEKAEWLAGMRGAFNAADRNRITEAMVYLKGLYEQYGRQVTYTPVNITHKDGTTDTTWRMDDIPTDEQLTLIVKNLLAFWKGVESASGEVVEVWAGTRFGYVELAASVRTGDYTTLTVAHGIREIIVTAQSDQLGSITVTGTGWTVVPSDTAITARYTVPPGGLSGSAGCLGRTGVPLLCRRLRRCFRVRLCGYAEWGHSADRLRYNPLVRDHQLGRV